MRNGDFIRVRGLLVLCSLTWWSCGVHAADERSKEKASVAAISVVVSEKEVSSVRAKLHQLVKLDAGKLPEKPPIEIAPHLNPDAPRSEVPVDEGVLVLEKFTVTKKREMKLPVRVKPTLENFFYGDGTILAGERSSLVLEPNGTGPDGEGLVSINIKIKF